MNDSNNTKSYMEVIDYLPTAKPDEMVGIALETAKSNPEFFMMALNAIRTRGLSNLSNIITNRPNNNIPVRKYYVATNHLTQFEISATRLIQNIKSNLVMDTKKVSFIKDVRDATVLGLKEAKDFSDFIFDTWSTHVHRNTPSPSSVTDLYINQWLESLCSKIDSIIYY
jgi:hypothetical protein